MSATSEVTGPSSETTRAGSSSLTSGAISAPVQMKPLPAETITQEAERLCAAIMPALFVGNEDIEDTWNFLDTLFLKFNSIEARRIEVINRQQIFGEKGAKKMRNSIRRDIGPYVLLGSQYLFSLAKSTMDNPGFDESVKGDWMKVYKFLFMHRYWAENVPCVRHLLEPYSRDVTNINRPSLQRIRSKLTNLRAAVALSRLHAVVKNSEDPNAYGVDGDDVKRALQEWRLIQRVVTFYIGKGISQVEEVVSCAVISNNLKILSDLDRKVNVA